MIPKELKIGDRVRMTAPLDGSHRGKLAHVRARFDRHVAIRWWSPSRGWIYEVIQGVDFQVGLWRRVSR